MPAIVYIADLVIGAALLIASYPLHAPTLYWTGLVLLIGTVLEPNVGAVVEWLREKPQP